MKNLILGFSVLLVLSCGDKPMDKMGSVSYSRSGEPCEEEAKDHWLMDLEARNSADSIYLNTNSLGRKVEVHKRQLDSASTVATLLEQTCEKDSIYLLLTAEEFYTSMNGKVPTNLKPKEKISVKIWMRDKLNDVEHIAYKKLYESDAITRYTEKFRWNGARDSTTGIYYEKLKTRKGSRSIKKAKIKYVIKSLNEQLIARSQDGDPFIYDIRDKGVLGGISFLVSKLNAGESARAVVPSSMAYGADGNTRVPGYMPIILELEVLEVLE